MCSSAPDALFAHCMHCLVCFLLAACRFGCRCLWTFTGTMYGNNEAQLFQLRRTACQDLWYFSEPQWCSVMIFFFLVYVILGLGLSIYLCALTDAARSPFYNSSFKFLTLVPWKVSTSSTYYSVPQPRAFICFCFILLVLVLVGNMRCFFDLSTVFYFRCWLKFCVSSSFH